MLKKIILSRNITLFQAKRALLNATVIENDDSLLVIDTFLFPEDTKELLTFCQEKNKPVKYIINTHWHSDHCYGNRFFDEFNPLIIAQEHYAETIASEKNILNPNRESIVDKKQLRVPNITFSDKLFIPEFDLELIHVGGHTKDSIIIYNNHEKIAWAGDNVLNSNDNSIALPYFYWGRPYEMMHALSDLAKMCPRLIITGHGNPCQSMKLFDDIKYIDCLMRNNAMGKDTSINACYPNSSDRKVWIPEVHEKNIEKLHE